MCVSPISLPNPRIDFRSGVDPVFLQLPCGNCPECRRAKRDDWFVRLYYEWKSSKCCLFPTFTFNDDSLPHVNLSDPTFAPLDLYGKRPCVTVPSFDKQTLINAIKKLRTRLERLYGDDINFKYFIVCEYGTDEEKTHRPHYHALFFFDTVVDEFVFKQYFEYAWSFEMSCLPMEDKTFVRFKFAADHYLSTHEHKNLFVPYGTKEDKIYLYCASRDKYGKIHYFKRRGFVSYSKDHGAFIKDSSGLNYVTKYLFKPQNYFENEKVKTYCQWLNRLPANDKVPHELVSLVRQVKSVLPFTLNSKGMGKALFDDLDIRSQLALTHKNVMEYNLLPNQVLVEQRLYKIPTYITNKLFFDEKEIDRVETTSFNGIEVIDFKTTKKRFYTELGREVVQKRFELKVDEMVKSYHLYSDPKLLQLLTPFLVTESQLEKYDYLVHTAIPDLIDFDLIAIYKLVYQNVSLDAFAGYPHNVNDRQFYVDFAKTLHACRCRTYDEISCEFSSAPAKDSKFRQRQLVTVGTCNNLEIFSRFDEFISFVDNVKLFIRDLNSYYREKEDETLGKELNEFFKILNYGF